MHIDSKVHNLKKIRCDMDKLIKALYDELENREFTKIPGKYPIFEKVFEVRTAPQSIVVNGRVFDQESATIVTKTTVDNMGVGDVSGTKFLMIKFEVYQDNILKVSFCQNFYDDELGVIINILDQIS